MKKVNILVQDATDIDQAEALGMDLEDLGIETNPQTVEGEVDPDDIVAWREDYQGVIVLYLSGGFVMSIIIDKDELKSWFK